MDNVSILPLALPLPIPFPLESGILLLLETIFHKTAHVLSEG